MAQKNEGMHLEEMKHPSQRNQPGLRLHESPQTLHVPGSSSLSEGR